VTSDVYFGVLFHDVNWLIENWGMGGTGEMMRWGTGEMIRWGID
jgi:hypothetical protein